MPDALAQARLDVLACQEQATHSTKQMVRARSAVAKARSRPLDARKALRRINRASGLQLDESYVMSSLKQIPYRPVRES